MTRQHGSIDEAIAHGGKMIEWHKHENNDKYSATVRFGSEDITWTNLLEEHILRLRGMAPQAKQGVTRQHQSIDELVRAGGKITSVTPHEKNDNVTVHVTSPTEGTAQAFTNISQEHLAELRKIAGSGGGNEGGNRNQQQRSGAGGGSSNRFVDVMKAGGTIVEYHPTKSGSTYAIHVKDKDGKIRNYNSVSTEHMQEFCPGFEEGTSSKGGGEYAQGEEEEAEAEE